MGGLGSSIKDVNAYTFQPVTTRFLVNQVKPGGAIMGTPEQSSAFKNSKVKTATAKFVTDTDKAPYKLKAQWTSDKGQEAFVIGNKKYASAFATNYFNAADDGQIGMSTYLGAEGTTGDYNTMFAYPFIGTYDHRVKLKNKITGKIATEATVEKYTTSDYLEGGADTVLNEKRNVASNVYSRMAQKEALHHSQGAFWMCIVVVQWADLMICKTRWLSIRDQGMSNQTMNFGLFFETLLAAWLAYFNIFALAFGTRNIKLTHWFPAMPFSMLIFCYDETRKYLMRATSPVSIDKKTGRSQRSPGWLERNTYY